MHNEFFLKMNIKLGEPLVIGQTDQGLFKVIPIIGGNFRGKLTGKVLAFGGDFNYRYDDCYSQAHARYILECEKECLYVDNTIAVDKNKSLLTHLHFTCDKNGKFGDFNYRTFLGKLISGDKESVIIEVYEVKDNDK